MQTQNDSPFPVCRAKALGYKLVQFDSTTLLIVHDDELNREGIRPRQDSNLLDFSPPKFRTLLENTEQHGIFRPQYQYFGKNDNFCIYFFDFGSETERNWMMKTNFKKATDEKIATDFFREGTQVDFNGWLAKHRGSTSRIVPKNADTEMSTVYPPLPSVEVPNPGGAHSMQMQTPSVHQTTARERDTSSYRETSASRDGSPGWTGQTPEPQIDTFGGNIVYGIEGSKFGVTKTCGLVHRNGTFDFEELRSCPDNLKIPGQNGGMAPKEDNLFVDSLEKADRSKFKIIGCAAKSKYKLVILQIEDDDCKNELQRRRRRKNYKYEGPLVCTLSQYRKRFGEDDIEHLENLLKETMFAKNKPATEVSLKKGNTVKGPTIVDLLNELLIGQKMHNNSLNQLVREVRAIE